MMAGSKRSLQWAEYRCARPIISRSTYPACNARPVHTDVPCVDGSELASKNFTSQAWSVQPCVRGKRHARKVRVGGDKTPVWWNCRQPPRIRQLRNPTGRKEGATMRMPGFTAEGSLYTSKTQYKTNHRHPNGASHNVLPQLPIRIGRTCGECISGVHGVRFGGFGTQQCCDFYCDPAKGQCFTSNCATEYCWSLGNVFDRGGGGINAGGGINTGGGVFNTGGGVSQ